MAKLRAWEKIPYDYAKTGLENYRDRQRLIKQERELKKLDRDLKRLGLKPVL
jgi:hypothetical protein